MLRNIVLFWCMLLISMACLGQEACCPNRMGSTGIGVWFHHDLALISLSHWVSPRTALTIGLAVPSATPLPLFLRGTSVVVDRCLFDLHTMVGLGIPVGGAFNWQRFEAGLGVDFCFPEFPELSLGLEVGVSLLRHLHCAWWGCEWRWATGTFVSATIQFFF